MAADELEALERIYARWGRGEWHTPPAEFADDMVLTTFDADGDELVCNGVEAANEWLGGFLKQWSGFRKEARAIERHGDRFLVICRQSGAGRVSGVPLDMPAYDVWTFEGGRVKALYVTRHEDAARRHASSAR